MTAMDHQLCSGCGIREHVNLLGVEIDHKAEQTGRALCIRCHGPGWRPAGGPCDIALSVAPELKKLYEAWNFDLALRDGMRLEMQRLKEEVSRLTTLAARGPDVHLEQPPPGPYLIWSNEHRAWWGPGSCGYAKTLGKAGRYTKREAIAICRQALGTALHLGAVAEIPVREDDVRSFLAGALVPEGVL